MIPNRGDVEVSNCSFAIALPRKCARALGLTAYGEQRVRSLHCET